MKKFFIGGALLLFILGSCNSHAGHNHDHESNFYTKIFIWFLTYRFFYYKMCEYVYIRSSVSGFNAKQILLLNYDLEVYGLANIKSAKKRVITSQVRAERNKAIKSRVKTYIKKVEAAVAAGDKAAANEVLPVAIAEIEKAASKGIFHKNAAARKVSHITKAVNAMA